MKHIWLDSTLHLFFFLTTGNINSLFHLYRLQFEDEFGYVGWRDIPRQNFSDFIYEFLHFNDKHNKDYQNIMKLKELWPAKTAGFGFLPLLLACVVSIFIVCIKIQLKDVQLKFRNAMLENLLIWFSTYCLGWTKNHGINYRSQSWKYHQYNEVSSMHPRYKWTDKQKYHRQTEK